MKKIISIFILLLTIMIYINMGNYKEYSVKYIAKNDYLDGNLNVVGDYKINESKLIIYNIAPDTTLSEFVGKFTSDGTISVVDTDNNTVVNDSLIKTGYTLKVEYSSTNIKSYKLSVRGDILGEGTITVDGVRKVAKHILTKNEIAKDEILYAADYDGNDNIKINDITKMLKDIKKSISGRLTSTFVVQDNNAVIVLNDHVSCELKGNQTSCDITAPTLNAKDGYTAIGWNTDKNATTASLNSGDTTTISESVTYYSITRNNTQYMATFVLGDSNSATINGNTNISCYKFNGSNDCEIIAPVISPKEKYQVVGWNIDRNATNSQVASGEKTRISNNVTYYSIVPKLVTITFDKNTTFDNNTVSVGENGYDYRKTNIAADSLEFYEKTCLSYNNKGCYIDDLPIIYSAGNQINGFALTPDEYLDKSNQNLQTSYVLEQKFTQDTKYYARVYNDLIQDKFTLGEKVKIGNVTFEFENGMDANVYSQYVSYLNKLYSDLPQLFAMKGQVRLSSPDTYKAIHKDTCGEESVGCTATNYLHSSVDVVTYDNFMHVTLFSLTHELSHAFDMAYGAYSRDYDNGIISLQEDLNALFNKYSAMDEKDRPLGFYAYSLIYEFWAESSAAYHGKVFNDTNYVQWRDMNNEFNYTYNDTTEELDKVIAKYYCIAKNNYNKGADC